MEWLQAILDKGTALIIGIIAALSSIPIVWVVIKWLFDKIVVKRLSLNTLAADVTETVIAEVVPRIIKGLAGGDINIDITSLVKKDLNILKQDIKDTVMDEITKALSDIKLIADAQVAQADVLSALKSASEPQRERLAQSVKQLRREPAPAPRERIRITLPEIDLTKADKPAEATTEREDAFPQV